MLYGVDLPNFGICADARLLAELARETEEAGWDGFFLWDHIAWGADGPPMVDAWTALTAASMTTNRIRLGPMVTPLARRRPAKVARETVSLDRLSGGRLIFGVGTGGDPTEFESIGDQPDAKTRAAMLDEALQVITGLWSGQPFSHDGQYYSVKNVAFTPTPEQQPRIPIWVAATWPTQQPPKNDAPFRRAARWDGIFPVVRDIYDWTFMLSPEQMAEVYELVSKYRESDEPFEMAHWGVSDGNDPKQDALLVEKYAQAGVTWWLENLIPSRWHDDNDETAGLRGMRERISKGPPGRGRSA